ncbi:MAG TPA: T9SS type A sorting domain-containing protein [Puia sp.]|nr:T9SS type A sorting domain-containing protein [Puia sp.]
MKERLQIHISTPCGEDWGRMDRRDEGRFCQQCHKTVVDFTGMTDAQVLGYFAVPRSHVCGRFLADQLERDLRPAPVQRNGWVGWRWVVASALMMVRPPEVGKPAKPVTLENRVKDGMKLVNSDVRVGGIFHEFKMLPIRKKAARFVKDTVRAWRPSIARLNSVEEGEASVAPGRLTAMIPGLPQQPLTGFVGAISVSVKIRTVDTNILQKMVDTVVAWAPFKKEDFVTMYPNPVQRGGALHLAWLSAAGKYQLALFNMRGQLVTMLDVEVGGVGQMDQWELPAGLAAGVYVLRITERGRRVDTREVVVR